MKKISVYIISVFFSFTGVNATAQQSHSVADTVEVPLQISFGFDITGPVLYFTDKNILNTEGYISYDLDEKKAFYAGTGYTSYKYSQYNYSYSNNGSFFKAGINFNLLEPSISQGKYRAGIGLLYGISRFTWEVDSFRHENYWGSITSSVPQQTDWGHYIEISPGFRAEIFRNISLGWSLSLKKLLFTSAPGDYKPAYFPGYGTTEKTVSFGIQYFITINFTHKKIKAIVKEKPVSAPEEGSGTGGIPGSVRTLW
ncbi:MAG: hypothetical protein GXY51_06770 [Bacteroidetes bacterium]|nr:hypothetical protein [Bacteroidota bacterium]